MDLKLKDNVLLSIDNMVNVDYILASGQCNTQLLTLASGNNYYIMDLDIEVISNETEGAYVFQATKGIGNQLHYLQCTSTNADTFNWAWATNNSAGSNTSFSGRCKIRIKRSSTTNSSITINGTSTTSTFTYGGDNYTHPLYLLPSDGITMKIWSIQIYKVSSSSTTPSSSNIIANFIPKISNYSGHYGEAALYDTISNTFKYSSSTGSFTAPTNIYNRITTAFIKDCPNVSGIELLRMGVNLQRIRCDVGNVSGSIEELQHYATLSGYSDNYEEQAKPRLVGTWTINYYYTNAMLAEMQAAFDGLTIVGDTAYNWETMIANDLVAVQTVDSTAQNYNPAAAIVLQSNSKGVTLDNPIIVGQTGRWFITKEQASAITSIGTWFQSKTSVTDTAGIVASIGTVYSDIRFNEFRYFTGVTALAANAFKGSRILEIKLPNTITTLGTTAFYNLGYGLDITIPSGVTSIPNNVFGNFPAGRTKPFITLLGNITSVTLTSFYSSLGSTKPLYIHFNKNIEPPTISYTSTDFLRGVVKVYFGDGSSEAHDNDIKASCYGYPMWRERISKVDTWYNYAIPKLSYQNGQVTITVTRSSTIYYTTDGSIPTEDSYAYTEPFNWDGIGVIKTIAVSDEGDIFNTVNGLDFYANTTSNPVITYTATEVTITAEQNATIYYTLDGTCPNEDSEVYTEPIPVTGDIVKVRCFARVEGKNDSEVVGKICVLDDSLWGTNGDSSYFAVQCIDNTKPNYNPAVGIILFNKGVYTDFLNGCGGYLTKTDASAITNIGTTQQSGTVNNFWFKEKTTVSNNHFIAGSYDFETFNEFKYFTSVTLYAGYTGNVTGEFGGCTKLKSIIMPSHITVIYKLMFNGCSILEDLSGIDNVVTIGEYAFSGCQKLKLTSLPSGLTSIQSSAFNNCKAVTFNELPAGVSTIPGNATANRCFGNTISIPYLHLLKDGVVHNNLNYARQHTYSNFYGTTYKIYVGNGNQVHDEALLADYQTEGSWSALFSSLDTWYNYLQANPQ